MITRWLLALLVVFVAPLLRAAEIGEDDVAVSEEVIVDGAATDVEGYIPFMALIRKAPCYPEDLKNGRESGKVTVVYIIDYDGKIIEPKVKSSTNEQFTKAVLNALATWRYTPTRVHQTIKVKTRVQVTVSFRLSNKKQPNQAVQHNDPSCHESCLRTPRASRGRG